MRKGRHGFVLVAVVTLLLFASGIANADPVRIDQLAPIVNGAGLGCCSSENWAQTFTVGITGILRTIGLPLSQPPLPDDFSGQFAIQLRATSGGVPTETILAETILAKSSLPSLSTPGIHFQFTTSFSGLDTPVAAGQQLAIVLSNVGHNGQNISWATNDAPGTYSAGTPFRQPREFTGLTGDVGEIVGPWGPVNDFDFAFFTAVEPVSATPEPGTALLLATGFAWLARRRAAL